MVYPLIKSALYYCARLISSQLNTVFTGSHYEKIQKVYSIWICTSYRTKMQNIFLAFVKCFLKKVRIQVDQEHNKIMIRFVPDIKTAAVL